MPIYIILQNKLKIYISLKQVLKRHVPLVKFFIRTASVAYSISYSVLMREIFDMTMLLQLTLPALFTHLYIKPLVYAGYLAYTVVN